MGGRLDLWNDMVLRQRVRRANDVLRDDLSLVCSVVRQVGKHLPKVGRNSHIATAQKLKITKTTYHKPGISLNMFSFGRIAFVFRKIDYFAVQLAVSWQFRN